MEHGLLLLTVLLQDLILLVEVVEVAVLLQEAGRVRPAAVAQEAGSTMLQVL